MPDVGVWYRRGYAEFVRGRKKVYRSKPNFVLWVGKLRHRERKCS